MSISIHTPDTYISMPWKNGKGNTIELLKENADCNGSFNWRLSKAQVSTDGEFSWFENVERTLVLLSGTGITLDHQHSPRHVLIEPLQFAQFSGAETTTASLHKGPIEDFNIMTKKGCCHANVITNEYARDATVNNQFDLLLIYSVSANIMVSPESKDPLDLPAQHLLKVQSNVKSVDLFGGPFIAIGIDYE